MVEAADAGPGSRISAFVQADLAAGEAGIMAMATIIRHTD
jgi:hypothetical protein